MPLANSFLYWLSPPINVTIDVNVPDLMATLLFRAMFELASIAHTPCGMASAGETTIVLSPGEVTGRLSGDLRYLVKN